MSKKKKNEQYCKPKSTHQEPTDILQIIKSLNILVFCTIYLNLQTGMDDEKQYLKITIKGLHSRSLADAK